MPVSGQLPLRVQLRDSSVFASYFAGRNAAAVATLEALRTGAHQPAVWIGGAAGTGRTHLLQALSARASAAGESAAYLPLADIRHLGPSVLDGCGQLAWVCIDDVPVVAARQEWERALFALHAELQDTGGRLVVAAGGPPAAAGFVLKDLASRFAGGVVLALRPLDDAERLAALQLRASQRGLELTAETAAYLLARLPRDMHSLCGFLDRLDEASLAAQRRLTIPFVSDVLRMERPSAGPGDSRVAGDPQVEDQ